MITGFQARLEQELERDRLLDEPDQAWIDDWLIRTYESAPSVSRLL